MRPQPVAFIVHRDGFASNQCCSDTAALATGASSESFRGDIPLPESRTQHNASPELRDRFLNALDASDRSAAVESAKYLVSCSNYLPSGTCMALGLPPGSRYAEAATRVLSSAASNLAPRIDVRSLAHLAKDGY
jgi:hypothetical protein